MKVKAIITGVGTALTVTIMGMLFITGYIMLDEGTAYYLPGFSLLLGIVGCLVGGIKAASLIPRGWWWQNGLLIGVCYLLLTQVIANLLFPISITWEQLSNWLMIIIASVGGSIIGYLYKRTITFRFKQTDGKVLRRSNAK